MSVLDTPAQWQSKDCFTCWSNRYQADFKHPTVHCRCDCSAHVCKSDCSVWFDRKWIPWKQDVTTGMQCWKWSGKTIKEGASVNEGERLQRLFLYMCMCVCCVCVSCVCVCPSLLEEVMMMDGGRKRDWSSCAQWELVWWSEWSGVSPLHFMCHISILWYNAKSMAWLNFMLWQKIFIHSVEKDPFVSRFWEFCVSVSMRPCLFFLTSVLSHVPSVASGQTAVLPQFDSQMSDCTMRLCPALHLSAPAVRQFTSAYYPKSAPRWSVYYSSWSELWVLLYAWFWWHTMKWHPA